MARRSAITPLPPLMETQARASHPAGQVWLSASAGTGKTQVLTARVLRLLLNGAAPESLLCLTFTKAGAAEMADRISERLGAWVTMPDKDLRKELFALGEPHLGDVLDSARQLFARVIDARGGGLRIQTIHGFCQTLLAGFPVEAGLTPGFRAIEGREEQALADAALAGLVAEAERGGRLGTIDRLKALAERLGEDGARGFLRRCAGAPDAMEALGVGVEARVRGWLGLHHADVEAMILAGCVEDGFDADCLARLRELNRDWGSTTGQSRVEAIDEWLALAPEARASRLDLIHSIWARADGEPRSFKAGQAPQEPDYEMLATTMFGHFGGLIGLRRLAGTAAALSSALTLGQDYARAYADAKRAAGAVDFNDMIRLTARLLAQPGIGQWIAYKLDQTTDHVLVDEAQDTNAAQWDIVKALAGEFFAGEGAKGGRPRTIFGVGDYKQSIFGFQGSDPGEMNRARDHFAELARAADQALLDLPLSQSFRSSQPILDAVDAVLDALGHEALGLDEPPQRHASAKGGSGAVTLWRGVTDKTPPLDADAESEEDWLSESALTFAGNLAKTVKAWTHGGLRLRNQGRDAEAGDILILLRSRGEMARLIVSRLIEEGVPVAGVDRLRLNAPIVVQDLLACVRFALQPLDDLSLAALLVSPLVGWSQDELYEAAKQRDGVPLWRHLRARRPDEALFVPQELLRMADLTTPYRFLEAILSGPIGGRRKIIARLGEEARDPVEELLNAALAFEREGLPSLQPFLDWFDRGDVEIKRDPAKPGNAVRVMTVHGAKGLQAPVVVLADATADPDYKQARGLEWEAEQGLKLPLFRPRKEELSGSLARSAEAQDRREREEHWRLLYVAMTRAEEHLFVGGALTRKQQAAKAGLGADCWHVRVEAALRAAGADVRDDGTVSMAVEEAERPASGTAPAAVAIALPDWASRPAPPEARPPRPLAPSMLGIDRAASPPPGLAQREAAARGVLLHALFERLPGVPPGERLRAAERWLAASAGVADAATREELARTACAIIGDPAFSEVFAPGALAEAPIAAVVDGVVVAGTVDRLLVTDWRIVVVDFKTGRRAPATVESIPDYHLRQMAAYAAALGVIFPDRTIEAALLYTAAPVLHRLDADLLARHKRGFADPQQALSANG